LVGVTTWIRGDYQIIDITGKILFPPLLSSINVVRIDRFKKFLKVLAQLPCLVLEVVLDGCDILLAGAIRFLVIIIAAGSSCDLPLFAAFGAFLSTFVDAFGRCRRPLGAHGTSRRSVGCNPGGIRLAFDSNSSGPRDCRVAHTSPICYV
jgi:hypothetical protein